MRSPFLFLVFMALTCRGQMLQPQQDEDPFFIEEPDNVTVIAGKKVLLKCVIGNARGRSVQWTFDNFGLGQDRGLAVWPHLRMVGANLQSKSLFFIANTSEYVRYIQKIPSRSNSADQWSREIIEYRLPG